MINGAYATSGGITMAINAKGGATCGYQTLYVDGIEACREIFESSAKGRSISVFLN